MTTAVATTSALPSTSSVDAEFETSQLTGALEAVRTEPTFWEAYQAVFKHIAACAVTPKLQATFIPEMAVLVDAGVALGLYTGDDETRVRARMTVLLAFNAVAALTVPGLMRCLATPVRAALMEHEEEVYASKLHTAVQPMLRVLPVHESMDMHAYAMDLLRRRSGTFKLLALYVAASTGDVVSRTQAGVVLLLISWTCYWDHVVTADPLHTVINLGTAYRRALRTWDIKDCNGDVGAIVRACVRKRADKDPAPVFVALKMI
jgi:hypothetical protein